MLSTSAEGDFSVSLPPFSLGAIVGGAAPLRKAGPVPPSSRPRLGPSLAALRDGLIVMDVM